MIPFSEDGSNKDQIHEEVNKMRRTTNEKRKATDLFHRLSTGRKANIKRLTILSALFMMMLLLNLASALAYYQSHNLSEIRNIDTNLDMHNYYIENTSYVRLGTSTHNRLATSSSGGAAPNNLYWGNNIVIHSGNEGTYDTDTNTQCDDASCSLLYLDGTGNNRIDTAAASGAPTNNNIYWGNYMIWHANSDGAGSGLSADDVDGIDSGSFLRSNAADTGTGRIDLQGGLYVESTTVGLCVDDDTTCPGAGAGTLHVEDGPVNICDDGCTGTSDDGELYVESDASVDGDIYLPQASRVYFDSTDTYVTSDTFTAENLRLQADGDVVITDDNLMLFSGGITIGAATPVTNPNPGELFVEEDVWIGQESSNDDDTIYFDSASSQWLRWDDNPGEFDLSADLNVDGAVYADNVSSSFGALRLQTGGTTRIQLDNSGDVGIGTESPTGALNVHLTSGEVVNITSAAGSGDYIRMDPYSGNNGQAMSFYDGDTAVGNIYYSSTSGDFLVNSVSGAPDTVINLNGGNVGVGTSTVTAQLTVRQDDAATAFNVYDGIYRVFHVDDAGNTGIGAVSDTVEERLTVGDGQNPYMLLIRENSVIGTDDILGRIAFEGQDGQSTVDYQGMITVHAAESQDTANKGAYMTFDIKTLDTNKDRKSVV